MFRTAITRQARLFTTSSVRCKVVPDAVQEPLKKVDRAVSDTIVKGIEKGEEAAAATKNAAGMNANQAQGEAEKLAGQAKGKASELAGEAKGKKEELKGEAKKAMS